VRSHIEALEMEQESLEFDVKNFLRDRDELVVDGRRVFTWREQGWSRLDQESLKAQEKAIHKRFMLSGKQRVFKMLRSG
jgi:hypothetical protein